MARKTKKQLARSAAAKKGWATRRAAFNKRSEAAKKGWKTRREKERAKKNTWYVKYHLISKHGSKMNRPWPFDGELLFSTPANVNTSEKATEIAGKLFKGEKPKGVEFKQFSYYHGGKSSRSRTITDWDDLMDFEFVHEDDNDSYVSETGKA